jgi:phosphatidate cytidylyltransferase
MADETRGGDQSDPRNWVLPDVVDDERDADVGARDERAAQRDDLTVEEQTFEELTVEDGPVTESIQLIGDDDVAPLRFGPDDTGPLPHWTAPPTGEVPKILGEGSADEDEAWSSLQSQGPVWRDDRPPAPGTVEEEFDLSSLGGPRVGALDERPAPTDHFLDLDDDEPTPLPPPIVEPDPSRVTAIRTRRSEPAGVPTRGDQRGPNGDGFTETRGTTGRDMPLAIGVGVGLAVLFLILARLGGKYLMVLVVLALAAAAVEFFDKVREQGYQPATLVGLVTVAALPLAAYWRGDAALPMVMFLAVVATLTWFMLSGSLESNPAPNTAMTLLGVTWIGLLGAFAALILRQPNGVETLLIAVACTVAYDVGGLFVGSAAGKTQMAPWISPNKTVEGLVGGMLAAILVAVLLHFTGLEPWDAELTKALWLGVVIAVAAPLGDFAESMLKRNLGIKDFGTLLPGHGGALDRIDAMLFVAPAVYYLWLVAFS